MKVDKSNGTKMKLLLQINLVHTDPACIDLSGKNTFPDPPGGINRQIVPSCKQFQSPDMIGMIVAYQHAHDGMYGNPGVFQKSANITGRYPGIDQDTLVLISKEVTVTAATTAKTAKDQFHQYSFGRRQRYVLVS